MFQNKIGLRKWLMAGAALTALASQTVKADDSGLPVHGFASAGGGYSTSKTQLRGKTHGVFVGGLDLYLTPSYGRMKALFEVNFDPGFTDASEGIDKERAQIGYTFADYLTLWVGRFHTPFGYWNTAYHHGDWLHNPIRRPRFLDFEDKYGVMPSHTTGTYAEGLIPLGEGRVAYNIFFGNGSRMTTDAPNAGFTNLEMNILGVNNSNWAFGGNLGYRFGGTLDGLTLGVNAIHEKINTDKTAPNPYFGDPANPTWLATQFNLMSAYGVYDNNNIEATLEWHQFLNKQSSAAGSLAPNKYKWSYAAVASLAYTYHDAWVPYVMYERTSFNQDGVYFLAQTNGVSYDKVSAGLRYNVNERAAIKLQYALTDIHDAHLVRAGSGPVGAGYSQGTVGDVEKGISHEVAGQFAIRF